MFHKDDNKISKTRSHFSRFAHYIRSAFGRENHPSKKEKNHGSMDDLNRSSPNCLYSNDCLIKTGENGTDNQTVNHANSVGNLVERTPLPSAVSSSRFRDELAAKLSAGPGFPFGRGAHRLGVVVPPVTVNHSAVASGDNTPAPLSPGSPSKTGYGNLGDSTGGGGGPIQDSYTEGAMLRIHLNRQRRHRARMNQPTAPVTAVIPLNCIDEVEVVDLLGKNRHSSLQHPPLTIPKPLTLIKSDYASFDDKEETRTSQKIPSRKHSVDSDVDALEYMESEIVAHANTESNADENVIQEEKKEDKGALDDRANIGVKHPQSDRLGTLSAQSFLLVGSVSREISSSTTTTNGAELLRSRSTGNSVESAPSLAVRQTNRPTSTPVGSVPQRLPELNQITSLSKQDDSFFTLSPKVEEEAKDDNDKLVPSVPLPDITATPNSELGGPKEKSVIRENEGGAPAVRLRFPPNHENPPSTQNSNNAPRSLDSVGEVDSNRRSRVCDLVKVFQQGGAT